MKYLIRSTKFTKKDSIPAWWSADEGNSITGYIYNAKLYSEKEAKHFEEVNGKGVCIAEPYNEEMQQFAIKQLEDSIAESKEVITKLQGWIKSEEDQVKEAEERIKQIRERDVEL